MKVKWKGTKKAKEIKGRGNGMKGNERAKTGRNGTNGLKQRNKQDEKE